MITKSSEHKYIKVVFLFLPLGVNNNWLHNYKAIKSGLWWKIV